METQNARAHLHKNSDCFRMDVRNWPCIHQGNGSFTAVLGALCMNKTQPKCTWHLTNCCNTCTLQLRHCRRHCTTSVGMSIGSTSEYCSDSVVQTLSVVRKQQPSLCLHDVRMRSVCLLVRKAHLLLSFVPPPEPVIHFHLVLAESRHRRTRLFHFFLTLTLKHLISQVLERFPCNRIQILRMTVNILLVMKFARSNSLCNYNVH